MTALRAALPYLENVPPSVADLGLSLDSDLKNVEPHKLDLLRQAIVQHILVNEQKRLAILLAGLTAIRDCPVAPSIRRNRTRNALSRAGVRTWADLGELSVADLRRLPGVGYLTVDDILSRCVERVVFAEQDRSRPADTDREAEEPIETIQLLCTWAARERNIELLDNLFQLAPGVGPLPPDLCDLWQVLAKRDPAEFAFNALAETSLEQLTKELLGSLSDTQREIYNRRALSDPPATLEELGKDLGFTRERARQIQISAQSCVQSLLASRRFRPLRWRASELRSVLGRTAPKANQSTYEMLERCLHDVTSNSRPTVERILLRVAGPYRCREGWLELVDEPELSPAALSSLADQNGLLPVVVAYNWLSTQGVNPAFHDAWIEQSRRFRRIGSSLLVWSGSVADKSVAILAHRGEPADAETLVAEVGEGHSLRTAQNGFLRDNRLVRVGRSRWALRTWGLEEYTGITDEIAQRINAAGGRARLEYLVEDLVQQFAVKEDSVKIYAEAPMFVLEEGWVRLRGEDEPYMALLDFASCKGSYKSAQDLISLLVPIDREALRGSGRSFPAPVAGAMGVVPGHPRTFEWEGGELAVTWPRTAAFGPSLGSLRGLALVTGVQEGESLRLDFNLISSRISCERIPHLLQGTSPYEALRLLTGIDGDGEPLEKVALALRVAPSEVRRRLIARGDSAVAALLPSLTPDGGLKSDGGLESALSELADLLES